MDTLFLCRIGNHNTFAGLNLNLRHGENLWWIEYSHAVVVNCQLLNMNAVFFFCLMHFYIAMLFFNAKTLFL
jgi:hypothetical protein